MDCMESWLADGGKPGTRVAYLHWFLKCASKPQPRKQTAYLLMGYATKTFFLHGKGDCPMTDGRRTNISDIVHGGRAIDQARLRAAVWVAGGEA